MQYNSHATNQDCVSEILKICGATTASYPINDITRRFNFALDRYFEIGFRSDSTWPLDDSNKNAAPYVTKTLTSGTNSYKLSTFTETVFNLLLLEVLDSGSVSHQLIAETLPELTRPFEELYSTSTTGVPTHYLKLGDFIYVRPTPNYTLAAALVAYINRPATYMAATDTTAVPGVPSLHHKFLCRYAALPYLIEKRLPQVQSVGQQIQQDEREIGTYFASRDKSIKPRLLVSQESNR